MRLTAIMLLAAVLQVSAHTEAQTVTYSGKSVELQKIFSAIKEQTGYLFFYRKEDLQGAKTVSVELKAVPLQQALEIILSGQPLNFSIKGNTVFVTRKEEVSKPEVNVAASERTVKATGTVYNEAGQPLSGANVIIKQTGKGTLTNVKGEFSLASVPVNSLLVISYVGYKNQQVVVKEDAPIQIRLAIAVNELDVQVVQAYGTTSKRLTTSDIAVVTASEIEKQPVMNPLLALQGKVAGLDVTQTSGYTSAPIKVELRGRSAIGDFISDPLYIIDGVPLTVLEIGNTSGYQSGSSGFLQSGYGGPANGQSPFFSINPSDIESISVLKDADATAIYGSRGANGVILITTKKGKPGKAQFDLHVEEGITKVTRFWKMMNTQQYLQMRRQALKNDGIAPSMGNGDYDLLQFDTTRYTDWQKALFGSTGKRIDVQAGLSGGDAKNSFRIGAGYNRTTDIQTVSGADQRLSLSFNLSHRSLDQRFTISLSSGYSNATSNILNLPGAITLPPNAPTIFDSVGNLNYEGWGGNNATARQNFPFGNLKQPYESQTNFLNNSLSLEFQPVKGLKLNTNLGYNYAQANDKYYNLIASQDPLTQPTGSNNFGFNNNKNWVVEQQATYDVILGKGKLSVLAGASLQQTNTEGTLITGEGYKTDDYIKSIANAPKQRANSLYGEYRYAAVFGRATYNLENKYILNINARRDGSSRFGANNQFGNFGSIGAAWVFSEENWFKDKISVISFAKLGGSYGTTGSDAVGEYQYLTRWSANNTSRTPYDGYQPSVPQQHANPFYRWQVNKKLEVSLNLGILKDKINLNTAFYRNRCGNQLVSFPTPVFSGFGNVTANSPALVENSGWEFTLTAKIIETKNTSLSINWNTSLNKNRLLSYPNISQSPYAKTLEVGKPLNLAHLFHYTGVNPQTGLYSFEDRDHDGQIIYNPNRYYPSQGDDTYVYDLSPKFLGGVGINFTYKNLSVSTFFNIKKQIGKNAYTSASVPGTIGNQAEEILGKQWQQVGDIATYAKFTTQPTQEGQWFSTFSDGAYTDASFIRLSNLAVSFNLSSSYLRKAGMQGCSIFVHANNLFVITKYKGIDPETQSLGSLPPSKAVTGGINFNF